MNDGPDNFPAIPITGKRRIGDEWVVEMIAGGVSVISTFETELLADTYIRRVQTPAKPRQR